MPSNWMTEEEANARKCPLGVIGVGIATHGISRANGFSGQQHHDLMKELVKDNVTQCSSGCPMWVWAPDSINRHHDPGLRGWVDHNLFEQDGSGYVRSKPLGGCGLRRLPR